MQGKRSTTAMWAFANPSKYQTVLVWFADRFFSGKVKCRTGSRQNCKSR